MPFVLGMTASPGMSWEQVWAPQRLDRGAYSQRVYGTRCTAVGQLFLQNSNHTAKGQTSQKEEIGDILALMSLEHVSSEETS